jgi:hypothetical protein
LAYVPAADAEALMQHDPSAYALAYEQGSAAVAEQAASLKDTRDRASTTITAAAAIATIAIGLMFRSSRVDLDWWGVLGLVIASVGFLGVAIATVLVWRPLAITVNLNAGVPVSSYVERSPSPMTMAEMHAELALWYGRFTLDNAYKITKRMRWFSIGLLGLSLETGGLTMMLLNVAVR